MLIVEFVLLAGVIVIAGTFLAKYADAIGELTGLGRTLAGMVLLAMATSMPELAVDCSAARIGAADLAVGDLLGSSLANLLILSLLDLTHHSRGRMLSRIAAAHALLAAMSTLLTGLCLLFLLLQPSFTIMGLGPGTILIVLVYFYCFRLVYFDQRFSAAVAQAEEQAVVEEIPVHMSLRHAVVGYFTAALVILFAGPFMAHTADALAEASGLGGSFVGTTFVAACTSLPEVVTSLAAVRMGAFDLAVGNLLGSNAFNMMILPAVDLFYDGPLLASVAPVHAVTATAVILITCVAMLGLLYRAEKRYFLLEPDATLVLLLTIGAYTLVYFLTR